MTKRMRMAVVIGVAVVLAVAGVFGVRALIEHRAEEAFIAEQYAKLEQEKAALEESEPPAFNEKAALGECERQWWASDEAHRFWEVHSIAAKPATKVSEELYTVSATVTGTDGQKDIKSGFYCTAVLDGGEWDISLS